MHRATVIRSVRQLVEAGLIQSVRRGSTSNIYSLCETSGKQEGPKSQNATSVVAKCNNATLVLNLKVREVASSASRPEISTEDPMPPYQLPNEWGRMEVNPEYARIREVLRAADDRIRRSRNPEAYARAIVLRERGLMTNRKGPSREEGQWKAVASQSM